MFLFAALVPPSEVLDDLWSVLSRAEPPVTGGGGGGRHASRTRPTRRERRRKTEDHAVPVPPLVDVTPIPHVNLMLAKFGNLTLDDANRLVDALRVAAAEWPSPRLHLKGYTPVESEGPPTIWVDLDGDLDELNDIARGVPVVAQGLRLFVDRRVFQSRVRLGSVNPQATAPRLEALLAELERYDTDAWWQTDFALYTHVDHGPDQPSFKPFARIPLGPHVLH